MAVKHLWLCGKCAEELETALNLSKVDDKLVRHEARKDKKCEFCKKAQSPDLYKLGVKV